MSMTDIQLFRNLTMGIPCFIKVSTEDGHWTLF